MAWVKSLGDFQNHMNYIYIHDIYDSIIFYICHDVDVFSVTYCPVILHCGIFFWRNGFLVN